MYNNNNNNNFCHCINTVWEIQNWCSGLITSFMDLSCSTTTIDKYNIIQEEDHGPSKLRSSTRDCKKHLDPQLYLDTGGFITKVEGIRFWPSEAEVGKLDGSGVSIRFKMAVIFIWLFYSYFPMIGPIGCDGILCIIYLCYVLLSAI